MHRILLVAVLCWFGNSSAQSQEKKPKPILWGSLSGKVIDQKTMKPVPDAIIFLVGPSYKSFPIHSDDKVRKNLVIQIPPGLTFDFKMLAHYPYYFDSGKKVPTGQQLEIIGDSTQEHGIVVDASELLATDETTEFLLYKRRRSGLDVFRSMNYLTAGEKTTLDLPFCTGQLLQSQSYHEMKAHVFVFSHPYFAITQKDGTFTMPRVPSDGEVVVKGWHEDIGYLLTKTGKKMTLNEGKNKLDIEVNK